MRAVSTAAKPPECEGQPCHQASTFPQNSSSQTEQSLQHILELLVSRALQAPCQRQAVILKNACADITLSHMTRLSGVGTGRVKHIQRVKNVALRSG